MKWLKYILTPEGILFLAMSLLLVFNVAPQAQAIMPSVALVNATGFTIGAVFAGITGLIAIRRRRRNEDELIHRIRTLTGNSAAADAEHATLVEAIGELESRLHDRSEKVETDRRDLTRLSCALANINVGVMVANVEAEIILVNTAMTDMLRRSEAAIRDAIGTFRHDDVIGKPLSLFSDALTLDQANVVDVELGGLTFELRIAPVLDDDEEKLGTVVAWEERTEEYAFQKDLETIVSSTIQGDLSQRIDASQQTGYSHDLAISVNELVGVAEGIITDTVRVFAAMAKGELSETIDADYEGSFDRLKQDANSTVTRLQEVIINIQQSSEAVNTAFSEINLGNINLSQRTEQQASSLEETASSMEEMTATVKSNAESSEEANQLAVKARKQAEKGQSVVGNTVTAMADISEASRRIADIIGVIDEIAFQTNLLALNASVEAARAGDQGRGFAVVAGEVRNLAGRSAEAAKEIKGLIEDSVKKVRNGTTLVDESGEMLGSIVARVNQVADIIADISKASQEQAAGIAQVNATINHMDDMTQQNAALVEEVSAASELAGEQASRLRDVISFFDSDGSSPVASTVDHRPRHTENTAPMASRNGHAQTSIPARTPTAPAAAVAVNDDDWEEF